MATRMVAVRGASLSSMALALTTAPSTMAAVDVPIMATVVIFARLLIAAPRLWSPPHEQTLTSSGLNASMRGTEHGLNAPEGSTFVRPLRCWHARAGHRG